VGASSPSRCVWSSKHSRSCRAASRISGKSSGFSGHGTPRLWSSQTSLQSSQALAWTKYSSASGSIRSSDAWGGVKGDSGWSRRYSSQRATPTGHAKGSLAGLARNGSSGSEKWCQSPMNVILLRLILAVDPDESPEMMRFSDEIVRRRAA
jgi:hypothetical protein